jgi:hypothetical protein
MDRTPAWLWIALGAVAVAALAVVANVLLLGRVGGEDPVGRLSPRLAGVTVPAPRSVPAPAPAPPAPPPATTTDREDPGGRDEEEDDGRDD